MTTSNSDPGEPEPRPGDPRVARLLAESSARPRARNADPELDAVSAALIVEDALGVVLTDAQLAAAIGPDAFHILLTAPDSL